jgi:hypothetical protein
MGLPKDKDLTRLKRNVLLGLCLAWASPQLTACSRAQKEKSQGTDSYCLDLLMSRDKHPSAIRLPPAEYDFCKNQVLSEAMRRVRHDAGAD